MVFSTRRNPPMVRHASILVVVVNLLKIIALRKVFILLLSKGSNNEEIMQFVYASHV
jgi:hypothetical protein